MINRLKKSKMLILLLFVFSFVILYFGIFGNYIVSADTGPNITATPEYSKEQIRKSNNFNVQFNPKQHYNLTLAVTNDGGEDKTVTISPNTAYTTNSGNISFDNSKPFKDSSMKYDFRSLFDQKERKITIPANSTSNVTFGLKMPPKKYQGIILGGFYINIPNDNKSNIKNNVEVNNTFSYGLAAVIHSNKAKAQPKIRLGNVIPNNSNSQMQVNSNIRNIGAGIISGMNVNSEITKNSNNKVVSKSNRNNLSMAPNSSFNYGDTIENSLSPGNYKVHLNITDDSGHSWNVSKDFRVNTREYVTHFTQKVPWTLYTLIGVIVLLALIIIFLVYYQFKNKHKKNDQSKDDTKY